MRNLYNHIEGNLYFFGYWHTNSSGRYGTRYDPGDIITIYGDVHLYAQFTERGYELEYDNNGGSGSTPSTQRACAGTSVQVADGSYLTKYGGYVFDHWNTRSNGTGTMASGRFDYLNKNVKLYAQYVEQYTVMFKDWDGTVLKTDTVKKGDDATCLPT